MLGRPSVPVFPCPPDDTTETDAPSSVLRRYTGPEAHELFALCRPGGGTASVVRQVETVYGEVLRLLGSHGASYEALVCETVYLRDIRRYLEAVLDTRERVLGEAGVGSCRPPTTAIGQAPLDGNARLEVSLLAVTSSRRQALSTRDVRGRPGCECPACARSHARLVQLGDETRFYAGDVHGRGGNAFDEAYAMFCAAEDLLKQGGMSFREVVRTWIYLRDIDRDYADLNRARREFFRQRGIDLRPASTGVGGAPCADEHDFSMSLHAVKSRRPVVVEPMSAPVLNEPWDYGSDFSRGLRVADANRTVLHVSGTASVDEAGRTAHVGRLDAQVDRMLSNITSLLAAQGAAFRDVVSAVTYLKHPEDAARLRTLLHDRGFDGFPNALVQAAICRPDLLCEAEAVAVLPPTHRGT